MKIDNYLKIVEWIDCSIGQSTVIQQLDKKRPKLSNSNKTQNRRRYVDFENGSHFICNSNRNNPESTIFISFKMTNIASGNQEFVNSLIGNTIERLNAKFITFYKTYSGLGLSVGVRIQKRLVTESLLLYLTETWKANIDKGKVVGVIFIDFRKAFDCVHHKILEFKMQGCGISGHLLVWLKDYLNNRKQYVEIDGKKSMLLIVEYGVPQGSLFGPRLFSIYVNDLTSSITTGELHLYANDTTACYQKLSGRSNRAIKYTFWRNN